MTGKAYNSKAYGLNGVAQTVAQSGAAKVQYVEQRGLSFWFRRRAPKPFRPNNTIILDDILATVGSNGYVRFSLKTSNRKDAGSLARKYAHLLDKAAEKAMRAQRTAIAPPATSQSEIARDELTPEEISGAAALMHAILLDADKHTEIKSARRIES